MKAEDTKAMKEAIDAGFVALTKKQYYLRLTLAAAIALLVGAGLTYLFLTSAGDEPPIRVKGGSLHLELLGSGAAWARQPGAPGDKKWVTDAGPRAGAEYLLYLAPRDPASCPLPANNPNKENQFAKKKVRNIDLLYHLDSDPDHEYWVEIRAVGNRTNVEIKAGNSATASLTLGPNSSGETLSLLQGVASAAGFIRGVRLGGNQVCTFNSEGDLDSILLAEE